MIDFFHHRPTIVNVAREDRAMLGSNPSAYAMPGYNEGVACRAGYSFPASNIIIMYPDKYDASIPWLLSDKPLATRPAVSIFPLTQPTGVPYGNIFTGGIWGS